MIYKAGSSLSIIIMKYIKLKILINQVVKYKFLYMPKGRNLLLKMDLLRIPFDFKLNYNEPNGTPFGGILSIILIMLLSYLFMDYWV